MGLYDREYTQERSDYQFRGRPPMRMMWPRSVVMQLIIANVAIFLVQAFVANDFLVDWFSVYPKSWVYVLQVWRLVTYQFLHGSGWHIFLNMLGLFFFGPILEQQWGRKKFLIFYLCCGAVGGLIFPLFVWLGVMQSAPLIGASGAILGVLAACAILFPHITVFLIIFPMPIRFAAVIITIIAVCGIMTGANAGGEAAHLGGMAAGAGYVLSYSWRVKLRMRLKNLFWQRRIAAQRDLQVQLDNILEKVHQSGLHSLSSKEKRILRRATKTEQEKNRR